MGTWDRVWAITHLSRCTIQKDQAGQLESILYCLYTQTYSTAPLIWSYAPSQRIPVVY